MASPQQKYLAEWFYRYTKNRDLMLRKLKDISVKDDKLVILTHKTGIVEYYYSEPFVDDFKKIAEKLKEENKGLLVYNTKKNFDNMIKAWADLSKIPNLKIFFVNPFSKLEKRWIINPYVHNKISDVESLEMGLNSMYVMVDPTTEEEIEQLTK